MADRKLGSAVGAKSVRACDNCVKKRARWYCAADDAFLCQSCDSSVHSANPLARRHERVRLKIASVNSLGDEFRNGATCKSQVLSPPTSKLPVSIPSWHQGFTRKARTPRQKKAAKEEEEESPSGVLHPLRLVPEISGEENSNEENEEQLLYRVPIFDPFVAELCSSSANDSEPTPVFRREPKPVPVADHAHGFLPSEMDLAEFAADVESLLGKGLDDESFDMEALGILDCDDDERERERECSLGSRVKVEDVEVGDVAMNHQADVEFIGLERESFELNFDYDSPKEEEKNVEQSNFEDCDKVIEGKKIFLRLNYKDVLSAWADQKSPWTTGERPDLSSDGCWPDCMGTCGTMHVYGDIGTTTGRPAAAAGDGGREARVSRYREKRRTRLFSKKIRYEVRKLNAEKRPRMKGRFVKRSNFVAATTFGLLNK